MAVPAEALFPDLCRPGFERSAVVLFMAQHSDNAGILGLADNAFRTFEKILVRIPLYTLSI